MSRLRMLLVAGLTVATAPGCLYRRGSLPTSVILPGPGDDNTTSNWGGDGIHHHRTGDTAAGDPLAGGDGDQTGGDAVESGDPMPPGDPNVDLGPWTAVDGSDLGPADVTLGGSEWGGGVSSSALVSTEPAVAADASTVFVAWSDALPVDPTSTAQEQNARIVVKKRTTDGWQQVGDALGPATSHSGHPAVGIAPSSTTSGETLWVAWEDNADGGWKIDVEQCDPSDCIWQNADGSASTPSVISDTSDGGQARFPVLAVSKDGTVWVAWEHQLAASGSEVEVSSWDGSTWTSPAVPSAAAIGDSYRPCITAQAAVDVGWQTLTAGPAISVATYAGGGWTPIFANLYSTDHNAGSACALAIDSQGHLLVAWTETSSSQASRVYLWTPMPATTNALYTFLGASATAVDDGNGNSDAPALAVTGTTIDMFWQQQIGGGHWALMGRALTNAETSPQYSTPAVISAGLGDATAPAAVGTSAAAVVAWSDTSSGNAEVYATEITATGSGFVDSGPNGTATAISGAASNGLGRAGPPSLSLDPNDVPVVAWSSHTAPTVGTIEVRTDAGTGWVAAPAVPSNGGNPSGPVVVAHGDVIGLAWMEDADTAAPTVYYSQLSANANAWAGLSGLASDLVANPAGKAKGRPLDLAISAGGTPSIVWQGGDVVEAATWDSTALWGSPPTILGPSPPGATRPSIAAGFPSGQGGDDVPVIAWSANNLYPDVLLCAGPPASCQGLGGSADTTTFGISQSSATQASGNHMSTNATVAVDSSGQPLVAWQDHTSGHWQIYLRRWNHATQTWDELDGSATGDGVSQSTGAAQRPSLAVDADGQPVIAWQDSSSGNDEIYLRRFTGTAWQELSGSADGGGISNSTGASLSPSLAVGTTRMCVAWLEGNLLAQQVVMRCLPLN